MSRGKTNGPEMPQWWEDPAGVLWALSLALLVLVVVVVAAAVALGVDV